MIIPFEYSVSPYEDPTPHEVWAALSWNGLIVKRYSISSKGKIIFLENLEWIKMNLVI